MQLEDERAKEIADNNAHIQRRFDNGNGSNVLFFLATSISDVTETGPDEMTRGLRICYVSSDGLYSTLTILT